MMTDIVFSQEIIFVDTTPCIHDITKSFRCIAWIKYNIIILFCSCQMIVHKFHISIWSCLETEEICLYKIKLIFFCFKIQIFIHIKRNIIIRLDNTYIFTGCTFQTNVHSNPITFIFLVNNNDTRIIVCISAENLHGTVC